MKILETTEYPTRYAAFDNPGAIVVYAGAHRGNGYEAAHYSNHKHSPHFPHLDTAGVCGEIIGNFSRPDGGFAVVVHAERPDRARSQKTFRQKQRFGKMDAALAEFVRLIELAEAWAGGAA